MKSLVKKVINTFFDRKIKPGQMRLENSDGEELNHFFSILPSETSLGERLLLYWIAKEWVKEGTIIELGPFLGGTTRALAKGILDSKDFGKKDLITIDLFDDYYDVEQFKNMGVDVPESLTNNEKVPFLSIFNSLHEKEDYFKYIKVVCSKVADSPHEKGDYSFLPDLQKVSCVFVDGCKSWYSMKDFVGRLGQGTSTGTYYIFQDYGRFTCFWIPVFMEWFSDYFKFISSIASTYVFKQIKPLPKEVLSTFTDEPIEMDFQKIEELFNGLIIISKKKGNIREEVILNIQKAAFFAYVDEKSKARSILQKLSKQKIVKNKLKKIVQEAMISPTYTPTEKIYLQ